MKRPEYLELIGHEMFLKKTLASLKRELRETVKSGMSLSDSIRMLRQMEEIRLGTLFLEKKIDTIRLIKGLSKAAEAVVSACLDELLKDGFVAIGMGKAGGREITFDSDLDLVFASEKEISEGSVKAAERLIRLLTSYTKDGLAYRVDMRLRPDGTKGPLISTVDSLNRYYSQAAHFWEFQALLKARPIGGDMTSGCSFMKMREEILVMKGRGVSASGIKSMRDRIQRELSREKEGYDIKLGTGGIEELEFTVQYLQLVNCHKYKGLLPQGTVDAVRRLRLSGAIEVQEAEFMEKTYIFFRTLESFLRLQGEPVLKRTGPAADDAGEFMGFADSGELLAHIDSRRSRTRELFLKYLS